MPPSETRQAILSAAITLMGRGGAGALSAAALAAEVGISKATVFHHFRSIDEIPVAALDLLTEQGIGMLDFTEGDLASLIAQVGEASFALVAANRGFVTAYFAFASNALFDAGLRAKLERSLARAKDQFAAVFGPHLADPAQARQLGGIVLASLDGLMLQYALVDNEAELREAWRRIVSALAREYGHAHRD
ncbi:MAG: TetR/AcrR family transcriptional regulator [Xanthomonadales bacterium]|nr:TetR/AcrR family transcriptional regulator [Xanthomonadales bacterium]